MSRDDDAVIQFDLTRTPLAQMPGRVGVPSEAELTALTVALLVTTNSAFSDLDRRELVLSDSNVETVSRLFEGSLSALARDFGTNGDVRARLLQFVGLRISAGGGDSLFF